MNGPSAIGSVGHSLEADLKDEVYDKYVIFTYGVSTELLPWFDASDDVVICGPDSTIHDVYDAEEEIDANIETRSIPSHAKVYLMWGNEEIKCWLGSFNLTSNGLYENVEWAASFQGTLTSSLSISALLDGDVGESVTESWPLNQVIELISSTFQGSDTTYADALLLNTTYPYVLVHTHRSNTLKRVLRQELLASEETVSITYHAPFVNARGIELFANTLEPTVPRERIDLTVRTCRLRKIHDSEQGLTPAQVREFEDDFGEFDYLVRAPGDQGNQLRSGDEIRSGFAHHKSIDIGYEDATGADKRLTLLTSANLTKNAWQHASGNFEIGLLLREHERNEQLHDLFGEELGFCYERPRQRELDEATKGATESSPYVEAWLGDYVDDRLTLAESQITLDWDEKLPDITQLEADVSYRELSTGRRRQQSVDFEEAATGFEAGLTPITAEQNRIIDFIQLNVETPFHPPDLGLTDFGIEELLAGRFEPEDHQHDSVIWDGTQVELDSVMDEGDDPPDEVILRRLADEPRTVQIITEPHSQPHLAEEFIQSVDTNRGDTEEFDVLLYVDVSVDPAIQVRHDHLRFENETGMPVDPLGYGYSDEHSIRYIFGTEYSDQTLLVEPAAPLDRYYRPQEIAITLPSVSEAIGSDVTAFGSMSLDAQPANGMPESVIDDETKIEFDPPPELPVDVSDLYVIWGYRGYDRFGEHVSLNRELEPKEPHRQIWFHGAFDTSIDGLDVTFLSSRSSVTIKEQPFARRLQARTDLLPSTHDLRFVSDHQLVAWLVFERAALLKDRAREGEEPLTVEITENGQTYDTVICDVLEEGGYLCIPLLGLHRDDQLSLHFNLKLHGSHPEVEYYAPGNRALSLELAQIADGKNIDIKWNGENHRIKHREGASGPTLNRLRDRIKPADLAEKLFEGDPFELDEREGLAIQTRRPGLLHLASR